jgi:Anti-sigma factor NepR
VKEKNDLKRPKSKAKARTQAEESSQGKRPRDQQGLSPALQDHIGRQLRAIYDDVAEEPVPARFLQLLKDLEQSGDK